MLVADNDIYLLPVINGLSSQELFHLSSLIPSGPEEDGQGLYLSLKKLATYIGKYASQSCKKIMLG